jgi:hypothetical protein
MTYNKVYMQMFTYLLYRIQKLQCYDASEKKFLNTLLCTEGLTGAYLLFYTVRNSLLCNGLRLLVHLTTKCEIQTSLNTQIMQSKVLE